MNWFDALQVFVKVAEKKSFSGAAKTLHMPTSKVTKLIQWLEHQLKMVLFIRTTRQVSLTERGEELFQRAHELMEEWNLLYTSMTDNRCQPCGLLTVAALPDMLSNSPFKEWLADFLKHYPSICIQTLTIHKPFSLTHSDADVFIGREHYVLDTADVIAKKLLPFNFGYFASPQYLKKHPAITTPADLVHHNCLVYLDHHDWEFNNGMQIVKGNFIADSSNNLLAMAAEGLGVIRSPAYRAEPFIQDKQLQPILEEYTVKLRPVSCDIFYKKMAYQPQKIKLFVEHVIKKI